jgi:acetolactate synthase-1/2/3 large subunit
VDALEIPFLTTYKAKGIISETSAHCLGSLGLSPVVDAEVIKLIENSDLLVLAGFDPIELRDAWLDAWPHDKAVLSLDWTAQTHRIFPVGIQAVGHLPTLLEQLSNLQEFAFWQADRAVLEEYLRKIRQIVRPRQPVGAISPAALFAEVSRQLQQDWILTVDVGAHRILANHAIACRSPGQMLQSNGLGCMGYALPAAIAAQLVEPQKPVIVLVGDGCLLMTLGELAVARERNLPIVIVVLNDSILGLIKLKQSKMQMTARGVDFGAQRFDRIADGFGVRGVRVSSIAEFAAALSDAVAGRQLTVIDAVIDPAEYWEQM